MAGLTRVVHQIKEKIIRFVRSLGFERFMFIVSVWIIQIILITLIFLEILDFWWKWKMSIPVKSVVLVQDYSVKKNVDWFVSIEKFLKFSQVRTARKEEEASISSRGNSAFKGEEASESSSQFGSESKQPLNLIMRNQTFKKLGKLFQDTYFIDKTRSQDSALQLEDLLSRCYHHFFTDYKQAVSVIEKFIEVS